MIPRRLAAVVLALVAAAAGPSTASLLPGGNKMNLVDCTNIANQVCPNSAPAPVVTFSATSGQVSSITQPCCKTNYLQCQNQEGNALCKTMSEYTITQAQGNSETICPAVPAPCTCQQALATAKALSLRFCPTPPDCCPSCECHGDPHCTAFDSSGGSAVWAICDDRDETCTHKRSTCGNTTYDGEQCMWNSGAGASGECQRAANTKVPQMTMYQKQYKSYFDSTDNRVYNFSIQLTLGVYGFISQVRIVDAGRSTLFSMTAGGKCIGNSRYPASRGAITIDDLPSGVSVQLKCLNNAPKMTQRWDVVYVKDPWYVPAQVGNTNGGQTVFNGYCTNNLIPENTGGNPGGCRIMDRQVSSYYKCSPTTPIATCKARFCDTYANRFTFPGATGSKQSQCVDFLSDTSSPTSEDNFVKAACALNMIRSRPIDPTTCMDEYSCRLCVNTIKDFPDQVGLALGVAPMIPTGAPTIACPRDLVAVGINRRALSRFQSGVQIDYNSGNGVWTGVFALLDEEIAACGGCQRALIVNGTNSNNLVLLNPGRYRVHQCFGVNTDPGQALCTGPPGYNSTVTYSNPQGESAVSTTFGTLFDSGSLVCSANKFPNCPTNYHCCIWNRKTQPLAWSLCMDNFHGGAEAFPQCAA